jgi:hypothetical protein
MPNLSTKIRVKLIHGRSERMACTCFNVGMSTIVAALRYQELAFAIAIPYL